jgi:hypothetical protein
LVGHALDRTTHLTEALRSEPMSASVGTKIWKPIEPRALNTIWHRTKNPKCPTQCVQKMGRDDREREEHLLTDQNSRAAAFSSGGSLVATVSPRSRCGLVAPVWGAGAATDWLVAAAKLITESKSD